MPAAPEYFESDFDRQEIALTGRLRPGFDAIATPPALAYLAALHRQFDSKRRVLLAARAQRQARSDAGALPDFLSETRAIRESGWRVAEIPEAARDRRVEITRPLPAYAQQA